MSKKQAVKRQPVRQPSIDESKALLDRLISSSDGADQPTKVNLIGVIQGVQDRFGYLPAPVLESLSRRTRVPLSRIYGVVSFYAQFYTEPRGKHTIRCCRGTACHVRGGKGVLQAIQDLLDIEDGQTTPDMQFSLETVACLGACFLAPAMMIDNRYFGQLTPQRVESILLRYRTTE